MIEKQPTTAQLCAAKQSTGHNTGRGLRRSLQALCDKEEEGDKGQERPSWQDVEGLEGSQFLWNVTLRFSSLVNGDCRKI